MAADASERRPYSTLCAKRLASALAFGLGLAGVAQAQTNYTPYAITTLAGSAGFSGSTNATGAAARFANPYGVAVDASGNVYVADGANHVVRVISSGAVVTTLPSTFPGGDVPGGIAIDGSGNLYVSDQSSGALYKITTPGGTTTTMVAAGTFISPWGVAVDGSGNVYVADSGHYVIRKVTSLGAVSTLAGSGTSGIVNGTGTAAQFDYPVGVAVDGSGNVYVTDSPGDVIRLVTSGGVVTTYAGQATDPGTVDGSLSSAQFSRPTGIAIDGSGNLYLTDSGRVVRKISAGTVNSLAGSVTAPGSLDGTGNSALFSFATSPKPSGIAVDASGNIYIADTGNNTIRKGTASSAVPPQVTTQPQSQTVGVGGTAVFSVVVSGTGPFTYQWDTGDGSAVSGATGSSYTISNAQLGNAGSYQVVVVGAGGTVFSNLASLTVNNSGGVAPSISTQPQSQTIAVGGTATFTVAATGTTPFSYQWNFNGSAISGATASSYSLTNAQTTNAGSYTVAVTNSAGSATSSAAVLTVDLPASISVQPLNQTVTAGAAVNFSVTASGTAPLSYQWNFNGSAISGATSSSYGIASVTSSNAGSYTVMVTNPVSSLSSGTATLTVNAPPSIVTQPQGQTIAAGGSVTFTAAASGTAPLSYQWSFNGAAISGGTGSSYSIANVQPANAGSYQVSVTNPEGTVSSSAAVLTVTNVPVIATQPQSQSVLDGSNATLSVAASGTGLSYQWYYNGAAITGATSSTLSLTSLTTIQGGGSYYVVVTNSNGSTTSNTVNVGVTYTSRLVDIAIISSIQSSLSMGFVTGGTGTSGSSNVLVRAIGPALSPSPFSVPNVLPDPTLNLVRQSDHALITANSGWGNPASNVSVIQGADLSTGAFALTNPSSLDSALVASLPEVTGGYSAVVAGKSGDSGNALTEVYDDSSSSYVAGVTPRLVNLSCLTQIAAGGSLGVGFVIAGPSGASSETVLIRVTGPALAALGVPGGMPDPQLSLSPLGQSTVLATNAGWGANAAAVTAADNLTGAFALNNTASKDSATVVTLAPGGYTVQVSSVSGAGGVVLVEIYEVP